MTHLEMIINLVRKIEPTLTGGGMYSGDKYENDTIPESEVEVCLEWIKQQKITKRVNTDRTSYALKHYVEEWHRKEKGRHKYISNGAMIAAIIAYGIKYSKIDEDLNVFAAIAIKGVDYDNQQ